ncbi:hypothetical protein GS449_24745 [Rhodococcus hoagii]|nr:hypothetical protein [Prescottella equi]
MTPDSPATIVTSIAGSRNQESPLPLLLPSMFFFSLGATMPPSLLVLVNAPLPITSLLPEIRRIVPLASAVPLSLTRMTLGATPLRFAEEPGTITALTKVAFDGISKSFFSLDRFVVLAPESESGNDCAFVCIRNVKVSPGATVSGAATVTDAAGVLVTLIVADARHVVVKSTVVVAAVAGWATKNDPAINADPVNATVQRLRNEELI